MGTKYLNINIALMLLIGVTTLSTGCLGVSETINDETAGFNGSFEVTDHGLPVNWTMYTPKTVPGAEFEIVLDTNDPKDGAQSLRYDVTKCSKRGGGFFSPGFTNQFDDMVKKEGAGTYRLTCWIKNKGSKYAVMVQPLRVEGGETQYIEGSEDIDEWQELVSEVNISTTSNNASFRIELSILEPGTFWIDDVKVVKL